MASKTSKSKSSSDSEAAAENLAEQVSILRDDVAALTAALSDLMGAKAGEAKASAKNAAQEAEAQMADMARAAGEEAGKAREVFDGAVARNPGLALGLAAGTGFLIGLLMQRR